jgi:hypothetical protein
MAKEKLTKDRQYHGQRETDKRQIISNLKKIKCCIHVICIHLLVLVSYTISISDDVPLVLMENEECHYFDKRQTISWPKGN